MPAGALHKDFGKVFFTRRLPFLTPRRHRQYTLYEIALSSNFDVKRFAVIDNFVLVMLVGG